MDNPISPHQQPRLQRIVFRRPSRSRWRPRAPLPSALPSPLLSFCNNSAGRWSLLYITPSAARLTTISPLASQPSTAWPSGQTHHEVHSSGKNQWSVQHPKWIQVQCAQAISASVIVTDLVTSAVCGWVLLSLHMFYSQIVILNWIILELRMKFLDLIWQNSVSLPIETMKYPLRSLRFFLWRGGGKEVLLNGFSRQTVAIILSLRIRCLFVYWTG